MLRCESNVTVFPYRIPVTRSSIHTTSKRLHILDPRHVSPGYGLLWACLRRILRVTDDRLPRGQRPSSVLWLVVGSEHEPVPQRNACTGVIVGGRVPRAIILRMLPRLCPAHMGLLLGGQIGRQAARIREALARMRDIFVRVRLAHCLPCVPSRLDGHLEVWLLGAPSVAQLRHQPTRVARVGADEKPRRRARRIARSPHNLGPLAEDVVQCEQVIAFDRIDVRLLATAVPDEHHIPRRRLGSQLREREQAQLGWCSYAQCATRVVVARPACNAVPRVVQDVQYWGWCGKICSYLGKDRASCGARAEIVRQRRGVGVRVANVHALRSEHGTEPFTILRRPKFQVATAAQPLQCSTCYAQCTRLRNVGC